jgi:excisionase family DNA binding protein
MSCDVVSTATATRRRLIDVDEVAQKLGMSKRNVFRLADAGGLPASVHLGRLRRWDERELDEWIANGCKPVGRGR